MSFSAVHWCTFFASVKKSNTSFVFNSNYCKHKSHSLIHYSLLCSSRCEETVIDLLRFCSGTKKKFYLHEDKSTVSTNSIKTQHSCVKLATVKCALQQINFGYVV